MLPDSEGWRRFHPLTPLLGAGRLGLFVAVALIQQGPGGLGLVFFGVTVAFAVIALVLGWLAWRVAGYRISPDRVEIRKGLVRRSHIDLPVPRIESVDVVRTPVARVLGLAQVKVEVVSQGDTEASLSYLAADEAERVRHQLDEVRGRTPAVDQTAGTPAENRPPDDPERPSGVLLASVNDRELFIGYALGPSVAVGIAVVALVVTVAVRGVDVVVGFGFGSLLAGGSAVYSTLRRVDRFHGFTLTRVDDELHIQRGFAEQRTQQVPLARIQSVRLEQPLLWRPFGLARLVVDIAGLRGRSNVEAEGSTQLLPVATRDEVEALIARLGAPFLPDVQFDPAPDRAKWRAPLSAPRLGVAVAPGFTVVRWGVLRRRIDVVTSDKLQSLRLSQGPWQRRLGLRSVHLDTAGPTLRTAIAHRAVDDAERLLWSIRAGIPSVGIASVGSVQSSGVAAGGGGDGL